MKRNDTLWKGILENVYEDFLRFFFEHADELFDIEKGFQFLDKELEQLFPTEDIEAPKFVDKLVKVFTKSGKEDWILVHIEVQGYDDKEFARRMFTYFYRILDKYGKPVTAIAIFTDANHKFRPHEYAYEYLGTKCIFQFNNFKIADQSEIGLLTNENPFSIIVLTIMLALKKKNLNDEELYNLKFSLAKNLLARNIAKRKINDLLIFLQRYVSFADPYYNVKFDKKIEELTENQKTMGIRELVLDLAKKEGIKEGITKGVEKGIEQSKTEFVKNLLQTAKFSVSEIANLADVTERFVIDVQKAV
ncbi:hypothetical protein L0657_26640 [Dyadobacter sp. CY345]|uniref:hypothetical protein n=1 Tax=Dyadobacter sp. CY345 TaxID=2909335 RepID=UPI001F37BD1E|nr:hypothetical protein [Dyadobacter sp. CY345]MCF2447562.1 hypothetical protein [Dyadobacter sp. CY345]